MFVEHVLTLGRHKVATGNKSDKKNENQGLCSLWWKPSLSSLNNPILTRYFIIFVNDDILSSLLPMIISHFPFFRNSQCSNYFEEYFDPSLSATYRTVDWRMLKVYKITTAWLNEKTFIDNLLVGIVCFDTNTE